MMRNVQRSNGQSLNDSANHQNLDHLGPSEQDDLQERYNKMQDDSKDSSHNQNSKNEMFLSES